MSPPETLSELRKLIHDSYETVGYMPKADAGLFFVPPDSAPISTGDIQRYDELRIMGSGKSAHEAVAEAFKTLPPQLGGKTLLWRLPLKLDISQDFESGTKNYAVYGRAVVLA